MSIVSTPTTLKFISGGFCFIATMGKRMILEPSDIERLIIDLYLFFSENPKLKLPMRYILLLSEIVAKQLRGHPAVDDDDMKNITVVNQPEKPHPPHK